LYFYFVKILLNVIFLYLQEETLVTVLIRRSGRKKT